MDIRGLLHNEVLLDNSSGSEDANYIPDPNSNNKHQHKTISNKNGIHNPPELNDSPDPCPSMVPLAEV